MTARRRNRRLPPAALGLLAVLISTACAQVAALAPVGGDRITGVRFAAIDVLLARDVAILIAPHCTATGSDIACTGRTVDGADIAVTSPADAPTTMTVRVGADTLYHGSVQDVLDGAARGDP